MTFDDAIKNMIKVYWEDDQGYENSQSFKDSKYNKKYFQSMEEEFFPKEKNTKPEVKKVKKDSK